MHFKIIYKINVQLKIEHFEIRIHLSIKSDIFTALIKIFIARFRK